MNSDRKHESSDRLESYGIYQLARQAFDEFWEDSEILGKDYRGRELVKQQVRSLDSICANIEEGYGRGFGKELPQHLKIARGEACWRTDQNDSNHRAAPRSLASIMTLVTRHLSPQS